LTQATNNVNAAAKEPGMLEYAAVLLGWLVPGLGHLLIGERARGIIFIVTIHGLFAAGMLLGGIKAINPPDQALWSYTQFLSGWPMIVANRVERAESARLAKVEGAYRDDVRPAVGDPLKTEERRELGVKAQQAEPGLVYMPKVQDIGAVYCGIAGMLNLLVVFDALLRVTGTSRQPENAAEEKGAGQ